AGGGDPGEPRGGQRPRAERPAALYRRRQPVQGRAAAGAGLRGGPHGGAGDRCLAGATGQGQSLTPLIYILILRPQRAQRSNDAMQTWKWLTSPDAPYNWRFIRNVLVKTAILFAALNAVLVLVDPLPALGRISAYNI